jgi:hypothetical protein
LCATGSTLTAPTLTVANNVVVHKTPSEVSYYTEQG